MLRRALLHDPPGVQHQDAVGFTGGRQTVGDGDDAAGGLVGRPSDGHAKLLLAGAVDGGIGFVHDQHPWTADQGSREGDQLPLSGRQLHAGAASAAADQGVVPLRELGGDLLQAGEAQAESADEGGLASESADDLGPGQGFLKMGIEHAGRLAGIAFGLADADLEPAGDQRQRRHHQ